MTDQGYHLNSQAAKNSASSKSTPGGSINGDSTVGTPLTSLSANASRDDLTVESAAQAMAKLNSATDR
jgi:ATP-binding cassette subfamily F protein 2